VTSTGKPITFVLRVHRVVKGCGLRSEWMSWMEQGWPLYLEDR